MPEHDLAVPFTPAKAPRDSVRQAVHLASQRLGRDPSHRGESLTS